MNVITPKPNRRARQIAVSDSVALVLCEDDSLWAYDLLVKVAEWERLPVIPSPAIADKSPAIADKSPANPSPKPKRVEEPAMDAETGEDIQPSPKRGKAVVTVTEFKITPDDDKPAKPPPKPKTPKRLPPHPNATEVAPDAETA